MNYTNEKKKMKSPVKKELRSIVLDESLKGYQINYFKVIYTIISILFFSFIYMFFRDDEFGSLIQFGDTFLDKFIDRLYYSVVVQTTLGLGDIYPASRKLRMLTMLQAISTIFLIVT